MEEPRSRDVDILGWGVGGGGVRVELWSDVVPRDRKSEESVSLGKRIEYSTLNQLLCALGHSVRLPQRDRTDDPEHAEAIVIFDCLLKVPATCKCISGTDLLG